MSRRTARTSTPAKGKPTRNGGPTRPDAGGRTPVGGLRDAQRPGTSRRTPGARSRGQPSALARTWVGRVPRAAWVCALVGFLNAACWSIVSPPFENPDEPAHFAYVQRLAQTGELPKSSRELFPPAESTVLNDLHYAQVRFHSEQGTIAGEAEQRTLESDLAKPLALSDEEGATGVSASQPPLYYALEIVPYALASGNMLGQVALMRLLSAVMGGLTALFAYLFLREALPTNRWAWAVGGLGVALAPLLAQMSGAINPDALLFAVSTALFYCLARGFRRGITPRLATATGAVLAIGVSTKLTFVGLVPGALLGVFILCAREARRSRPNAWRCLGLALGVGAIPVVLYGLVNLLSGDPLGGVFAGVLASERPGGSLFGELSYIWQFYLPPLPGMSPVFHGLSTTQVFWFNGLVGLYGWLDAPFPEWVYNVALIPAAVLAVLLAGALIRERRVLPARVGELAVYATTSLGLLLLIGADDYVHQLPGEYAEPRYVLPLIALWGAALALAARGVGRRWAPVAGVAIVCLALAHDIFSGLLVVSRYYG
ncbi:MAG TPA: DUF2142 domain-containing protein [Solirubrobacteraceae bacterium]|jgi:hypothetical protein|nr:DUF2142 domain-containing protein [Solirubrobacteraceae bacterium]